LLRPLAFDADWNLSLNDRDLAERIGRGMTQGAVVIVSGASSGIGQACAARMVVQGCRVFGMSRTPPPDGAPFKHLPVDVTNDNDVEAGVQEVFAREQRIDVLINSAGDRPRDTRSSLPASCGAYGGIWRAVLSVSE
jgi:NAD(P)-dependent dehydrogenase (short-subunit alcohol dehydrogenase family)